MQEKNLIFLETADVAAILGVTPTRVRQMETEGKIHAGARTVRGGRLFLAEDVEIARLAHGKGKRKNRTAARALAFSEFGKYVTTMEWSQGKPVPATPGVTSQDT